MEPEESNYLKDLLSNVQYYINYKEKLLGDGVIQVSGNDWHSRLSEKDVRESKRESECRSRLRFDTYTPLNSSITGGAPRESNPSMSIIKRMIVELMVVSKKDINILAAAP